MSKLEAALHQNEDKIDSCLAAEPKLASKGSSAMLPEGNCPKLKAVLALEEQKALKHSNGPPHKPQHQLAKMKLMLVTKSC